MENKVCEWRDNGIRVQLVMLPEDNEDFVRNQVYLMESLGEMKGCTPQATMRSYHDIVTALRKKGFDLKGLFE